MRKKSIFGLKQIVDHGKETLDELKNLYKFYHKR